MNAKSWLTAYGLVSALVIAGAGFFCFSSYQSHLESLSSWNNKSGTVQSLERKVPFPSSANVTNLKERVDSYSAGVDGLFNSLNQYQQPLNTTLRNIEFQDKVKTFVAEFAQFARSANLDVDQTESSAMGFATYNSSLPSQELVPILDFELRAIDYLLRALATSGSKQLLEVFRDPIPGEAGGPQKQEAATVHRYPVRIRFVSSQAAFQNFLNLISNDKSFFYAVRVLQVTNEKQEGPERKTDQDNVPRFTKLETQEPATPEKMTEWGWPNSAPEELRQKAIAEGYMPVSQARLLMGDENLEVFMLVDIIRFINPEEVKALQEEESQRATERSRTTRERTKSKGR